VARTSVQTEATTLEQELETEILRSLRRILRAVDLHGRGMSRRYGLTGAQVICLREIQRQGDVNPGALAREMSLKPPTMTGILDRLESRGLVSRRRRDRDKRQVLVTLTERGEATLAQAPPPLQEKFTERLARLPATRRESIAAALDEVVALLEAENIDAAPLLAHGAANPADPDHPPPGSPVGEPTDAPSHP